MAELLNIGGKRSCLRAKAAHFPGHLPSGFCKVSVATDTSHYTPYQSSSIKALSAALAFVPTLVDSSSTVTSDDEGVLLLLFVSVSFS